MTAKPKTRKAPAANDDPIFGAIAEHKALSKKMYRLCDKLEEAEFEAAKTHGKRPSQMIWWRNCDAFSEDGVDYRRDQFLSQPGADSEQIEKEYLDGKTRMADAERACAEWDERAGIAPLREQYERASRAEREAVMRMARTTPMTLAGAASLVDRARRELDACNPAWPPVALKSVARALTRMNAEAA